MARTGAMSLATCACIVTVCGCVLGGCFTFRVGSGSFENVPSPIANPGDVTALELSWDFAYLVGVGTYLPRDGDSPRYVCFGLDWGALIPQGGIHPERQYLIAYTYVGHWYWAASPEEDGRATGVRLGGRIPLHRGGDWDVALEVSYDWKWLKDVSGSEDARIDTVWLGVALID